MDAKIFSEVPNELKTIEVDVEKKTFKVNGVPFGNRCTHFYISCTGGEGFNVKMELDTEVQFASYGIEGKKLDSWVRERSMQ